MRTLLKIALFVTCPLWLIPALICIGAALTYDAIGKVVDGL